MPGSVAREGAEGGRLAVVGPRVPEGRRGQHRVRLRVREPRLRPRPLVGLLDRVEERLPVHPG